MSKMPAMIAIPPIPSGSNPMRSGTAAVRCLRDRWWVMTGLIVLITASAVGWNVAVGTYLRRTTAIERPGSMALVPGSDAGPGTGSDVSTATRTVATDLPGPAPDPGHPSGRAEDSPAPQQKSDAAEPPPRISVLLNPGPVPARPAADAEAPAAGDPQSLGASSSPGSGCPMIPDATAATAWGRSITRTRAWPATTRRSRRRGGREHQRRGRHPDRLRRPIGEASQPHKTEDRRSHPSR